MSRAKISRNDPCPCGSGKKFKHCHYGQDIDWPARQPLSRPLPRLPAEVQPFLPGTFTIGDAKLKAIAQATAGPAPWKDLVERLGETTSMAERMKTYEAIGQARVIPEEAADFLVAWLVQWLPSETSVPEDLKEEDDDLSDEAASAALDMETLHQFRKFGRHDLAELYAGKRLEYDRRHERGRSFFHGPPEEQLAKPLREKGIIE